MSLLDQAKAQADAIKALLAARGPQGSPRSAPAASPAQGAAVPIIGPVNGPGDFPELAGRLFTEAAHVEPEERQLLNQGSADLLMWSGTAVELFSNRPLADAVSAFLDNQTPRILYWRSAHPDGPDAFVFEVFRQAIARGLPVFPAWPRAAARSMLHADAMRAALMELKDDHQRFGPRPTAEQFARKRLVADWAQKFDAWTAEGRATPRRTRPRA